MRNKRIAVLFMSIFAGFGLLASACDGTNVEDNDTGDDSNVTNTQPTTAPVIQRLNDDDPTPKPSGTDCTPTGDPQGTAAKAGTQIKTGECAIVEVVDFDKKHTIFYAGSIPMDFTIGVIGNIHINAWVGFNTASKAQSDMCTSLVPERKSTATFEGFTFEEHPSCNGSTDPGKQASTPAPAATTVPTTVPVTKVPANTGGTPSTGIRLTGECTGTPAHTDGHIRSVDNGATAAKGTLVVLRQVDNADGIEWIEFGCLLNDLTAGKNGLNAHDLWVGYSSVLKAQSDACGQAIGDLRGSKVQGSWNNMYQVLFLGSDGNFAAPPATCPAR